MWCFFDGNEAEPVRFPDQKLIREFLGDPDTMIDCPTPAQEIIFGKHRRRIPNWFQVDIPVLTGATKHAPAQTFEHAARQRYQFFHLPELIQQAMQEYGALTGRKYDMVNGYEAKNAKYLILGRGKIFQQVREAMELLRPRDKKRLGALNLHVDHPFPYDALRSYFAQAKAITILDEINPGRIFIIRKSTSYSNPVCHSHPQRPDQQSGFFGTPPFGV